MQEPQDRSNTATEPPESPPAPSGAPRRRRWLPLAAGVGLLGGLASLLGGCGSLSKAELRERLLALPKNRPLAEHGLRTTTFRADLGQGERELELVHLHVPADPAGAEGDGAGDAAAPERLPVVLVHGTPDTLFAWTPVVFGEGGLAGEREVHAIELPGHGIGPASGGGLTFERCARFVAAALEALSLERVHLVGNSYGGEFVWRAALLAPERVASVTLVDSSGIPRREGDWLPEEEAMRDNPLAGIGYLLNSEERIQGALAPHFDEVPEGRAREVYLVCSNADNWKAMVALARDENGEAADRLPELTAPALVVWGADDVAYEVGYYGERFARDLPDARLVVMPDTGHYPHEQRRAAFLAEVRSFWSEVEAR